ncbi:polysaccharide biosynthesis/export family protein [Spirosoma sp. BT702]|uniref:Polysaccharide biosynthesis/export family protein n=1 Tax=Spirosoma profusum TaxID=2771354 RepID=A0A926XYV3_9BACT|nr:polysaccharide biosynthesis/export family protein [Spirosoma profusum]MBD2703312.1 polysaccharide biosynthesis/export family protein [Spirosoma profusum]
MCSHVLLTGIFILFISSLIGCATSKQLGYFQEDGTNDNNKELDSIFAAVQNIPLSKGTILTIRVNSITPPNSATVNPFDPILIPGKVIDPPIITGFLINEEGNIALPLVGLIPAAGKTTAQLATDIRAKLRAHLLEPTVTVEFTTRISVLGEVNKPALFTLSSPILSLPQALGLAGDLTTYARRDNILVIRYNGPNNLIYQRIDLTKRSILHSPFYFLRAGDVVYVSPGKDRAASVDRAYRIIPIALSALTVIASVLSLALR